LPRLAEIHLHDSPDFMKTGKLGYGKDHQTLGTGDLVTKWLFQNLENHNFNGPVIFELSIEQAQQSLSYLSNLGVMV